MADNAQQPSERRQYEVETRSGVKTTLNLTPEDADAMGVTGKRDADDSGEVAAESFVKARSTGERAPANKARSTDTK